MAPSGMMDGAVRAIRMELDKKGHKDTGILGNIFTMLPPVPILFIAIFTGYQGVVNAFRALSDKPVRYALSIPFVK